MLGRAEQTATKWYDKLVKYTSKAELQTETPYIGLAKGSLAEQESFSQFLSTSWISVHFPLYSYSVISKETIPGNSFNGVLSQYVCRLEPTKNTLWTNNQPLLAVHDLIMTHR